MPVIVTAQDIHPFLPSLGDPAAIAQQRALKQDIRPLQILILNLMADKQATERQLAHWLGHTPLQVQLTFAATDSYMNAVRNGRETKNTDSDHLHKFYRAWSEIKDAKFDGLIVTGINALEPRVDMESFWPEVQSILEWSRTHVFSSLFLCWGAKAALKHFHNIDSLKGEKKTWGLFEHRLLSDKTGVAFGLPDRFMVPVSRWKNPDEKAIMTNTQLEVIAHSVESGPNVITEPEVVGERFFPRRLYVLNHPEYDTDTLKNEYVRDAKGQKDAPRPAHYFPDDDPMDAPLNQWRHTGFLYTNWISLVYAFTPYEIEKVPQSM